MSIQTSRLARLARQLEDREDDALEQPIKTRTMESVAFDGGVCQTPGSPEIKHDFVRNVEFRRPNSFIPRVTLPNVPKQYVSSTKTSTVDEKLLDGLEATVTSQECTQLGKLRRFEVQERVGHKRTTHTGSKYLDLKDQTPVPAQTTPGNTVPKLAVSFRDEVIQQSTSTTQLPNASVLQHIADYEQRARAMERAQEAIAISERGAYVNSDCSVGCSLCKKCFQATVQISRALKQHYEKDLAIKSQQCQVLEREKANIVFKYEMLKTKTQKVEPSLTLEDIVEKEGITNSGGNSSNNANSNSSTSAGAARYFGDELRHLHKWTSPRMHLKCMYDMTVRNLEEARSHIRQLRDQHVWSLSIICCLMAKLLEILNISQRHRGCSDDPRHKSRDSHTMCSTCHRTSRDDLASVLGKSIYLLLQQDENSERFEYDDTFANKGIKITRQVFDDLYTVEQLSEVLSTEFNKIISVQLAESDKAIRNLAELRAAFERKEDELADIKFVSTAIFNELAALQIVIRDYMGVDVLRDLRQHTAEQLAKISEMKTYQIQRLYMEHAQALDSAESSITPEENVELSKESSPQDDSASKPEQDLGHDATDECRIGMDYEADSRSGNDADLEDNLDDNEISASPDHDEELEGLEGLIVGDDNSISSLSSSTTNSTSGSTWVRVDDWDE